MKDESEVIHEFNDIVNMTAEELEKWLRSGDSRSAGWPKEDESGESVGHDSGRRIVEILRSNPDKDPAKYTEDQIRHMRKVVSYCKRHLAQEEKMNSEKPVEEVKKSNSYASLKNWGHDFLKKREDAGDDVEGTDDEGNEGDEEQEEEVGDKRKKPSKSQSASNKKRETRQSKATSGSRSYEDAEEEQDGEDDDDYDYDDDDDANDAAEDDDEEDVDNEDVAKAEGDSGKPKKGPKPGETVSWNWGGGNPKGKVLDVKGEKATVTTKRGNKVSRDGDPEDPAVVLDTGKSKAVKANHELNSDS